MVPIREGKAITIPESLPKQVSVAREIEISYNTLHPKAKIYDKQTKREITVPFMSLMNKYKDLLSTIVAESELTSEEQDKYRFKPKMLSEDLYGTTELWDTILVLNNAFSLKEFRPKKVRYYDPTRFKKYLNEIMIIEKILR